MIESPEHDARHRPAAVRLHRLSAHLHDQVEPAQPPANARRGAAAALSALLQALPVGGAAGVAHRNVWHAARLPVVPIFVPRPRPVPAASTPRPSCRLRRPHRLWRHPPKYLLTRGIVDLYGISSSRTISRSNMKSQKILDSNLRKRISTTPTFYASATCWVIVTQAFLSDHELLLFHQV